MHALWLGERLAVRPEVLSNEPGRDVISPVVPNTTPNKGTQHGLNNGTAPRFDNTAAKLAWDRTIALFNRTLRDAPSGQAAHR